MKRLVELWQRIPRVTLFAVVGLLQIAILAWAVIDRAGILRNGREVTLQTRPVDPRDWLRGDYVTLSYDISQVQAGVLEGAASQGRRSRVYVKLVPNDAGIYTAASIHAAPVATSDKEVLIRGRIGYYGADCGDARRSFCKGPLPVRYGIEKYFVPEGEGGAIEQAQRGTPGRVTVVAAVMPDGRAAIKRLLIDGKPAYDEPLY